MGEGLRGDIDQYINQPEHEGTEKEKLDKYSADAREIIHESPEWQEAKAKISTENKVPTNPEVSTADETPIAQSHENSASLNEIKEEDTERKEYCARIEKIYEQFITKYGPVKPESLKDYLTTEANFGSFLSDLEKEDSELAFTIMDDMGRRFLIDAIITSDQEINDEEKEHLLSYFMGNLPYSDPAKSVSYFLKMNLKIPEQFITNYPNPEHLEPALVHLYKKSERNRYISNLVVLFMQKIGPFGDDNNGRIYDSWFKSLPKEFKTLYQKATETEGYSMNTMNPRLSDDILTILKIFYRNNPGEINIDDLEEKFSQEAIDELFLEARRTFGDQFCPPSTNQKRNPFSFFKRRS